MSACTSGTRGSCVLSSTGGVLVRGVGSVCDMCMCYNFNSDLYTFLHPGFIFFPFYMSIPSHPTTSDNSCARLNSCHYSQCFTGPSISHLK